MARLLPEVDLGSDTSFQNYLYQQTVARLVNPVACCSAPWPRSCAAGAPNGPRLPVDDAPVVCTHAVDVLTLTCGAEPRTVADDADPVARGASEVDAALAPLEKAASSSSRATPPRRSSVRGPSPRPTPALGLPLPYTRRRTGPPPSDKDKPPGGSSFAE